ncbi:peptide chain release factor 1 [Candidatus Tachikawaea gelatinosa]|uniref:Peptide chain release factor 1 n=1 Tax=Candidatus Tachikawaea gelatinosa TaxID=1410383 RepID=A0A090ALT3_9ENTR|nr:peptide chain release factor 1 [Candidatus Tachikawaea gelatinosa]BAP58614.1 peptide chain release factor 1 [Candidatus Tachikawaea gelatinosa]
MKKAIIEKLKQIELRHKKLEKLLSKQEIILNNELFYKYSKEYTKISKIYNFFVKWQNQQNNIDEIKSLLQDSEIYEIAQEELNKELKKTKLLEKQIHYLLLPKDDDDKRNCFIEIRAGIGGNEAAIFAGDLFKMYTKYVENNTWKIDIMSFHEGEHGGFKEIIAKIIGKKVYEKLKFESGGHRVQRVPETESQGRIHTSTCTVAVMPILPKSNLPEIKSNDLKIDTFRSSGAGGQHVNTTDSAIRITHLPTGIVVECQAERSQHKNKAKALEVLVMRINAAEIKKRQSIETSIRRELLGSGERSDRIRTYNFPKNRITDHRTNLTLYQLYEIMNGKLDSLINPIIQAYQEKQLLKLINQKI